MTTAQPAPEMDQQASAYSARMRAGVWIPRAHVKGCVSVVWLTCNPSVREVKTEGLWSKLLVTPAKAVSSSSSRDAASV